VNAAAQVKDIVATKLIGKTTVRDRRRHP